MIMLFLFIYRRQTSKKATKKRAAALEMEDAGAIDEEALIVDEEDRKRCG